MELEEVEIIINKKGQVTLSVRGSKGLGCLTITEELEHLLGNTIVSRIMTSESVEDVENQAPLGQNINKTSNQ
jgi:hypothetical protein